MKQLTPEQQDRIVTHLLELLDRHKHYSQVPIVVSLGKETYQLEMVECAEGEIHMRLNDHLVTQQTLEATVSQQVLATMLLEVLSQVKTVTEMLQER